MRWPADMGGMHGFGPIHPDPHEPLFHAAWERRVLGLMLAVGATGSWTIDQSRHARETLPPRQYWSLSYYEIWFAGLTKLLHARDMVTAKDEWAKRVVDPPKPVKRVLKAEQVAGVLAKGSAYTRELTTAAAFKVGDHVRTTNILTNGHTRLPSYARLKRGVIDRVHGAHVFPDSNGMGQGEDPKWLYSVKFTADELWGRPSRDHIYLDLWEPYLEHSP
jgi:nitrile hydratase subunit beta